MHSRCLGSWGPPQRLSKPHLRVSRVRTSSPLSFATPPPPIHYPFEHVAASLVRPHVYHWLIESSFLRTVTGQAPGSRNHGSRSRSSLQAAGGGGGNGGEPLLTIDSMMKTHDGEAILFSDVNFTVHRGDKLVIVGPNGSGTLDYITCVQPMCVPQPFPIP